MKAIVVIPSLALCFAIVFAPQQADADCAPSCVYQMCDVYDLGMYRVEADQYEAIVQEFVGGTELPGLNPGDALDIYNAVDGPTSYLAYVMQNPGGQPYWVSSMFALIDGRAHCDYQDASIEVHALVAAVAGDSCVAEVEAAGVEKAGPCNDTCSFVSAQGGITTTTLILFGLLVMARRRKSQSFGALSTSI